MEGVACSPVVVDLSAEDDTSAAVPLPLLTQAHRDCKAARALEDAAKAAIAPPTPTKRCRAESNPSTTGKSPMKGSKGKSSSPPSTAKPPREDSEPCLKGVPPMVPGQTWSDWANTPTAADMPPPSWLVLQYAEKRRFSQRQLDRREEAARVEGVRRKAAEAVAALQAAVFAVLPKKSRSGPSGWTREWNKAKEAKAKAQANNDMTPSERETKAEVESDRERDGLDTRG